MLLDRMKMQQEGSAPEDSTQGLQAENQTQSQPAEMPGTGGVDDDSIDIPDGEPASPEEEAAMQRAQGALGKVLYENEKSFNSVVQKLQSSHDKPLNRLIDTTLFLVTMIDKQINVDESVILPFVAVVYDKVYEIAVTAGAFELDDPLIKKGLMATIQLALESYGVSEEDFNEYAESIGQKDAGRLINFYKKESA